MEGKKELVNGYYLQDINNYLEYLSLYISNSI